MTVRGVLESCPDVAEQILAEMPMFRARRPRFTVMDNHRLSALLGQAALRPWPEALAEHVALRGASR
jgi:hypothetical protein